MVVSASSDLQPTAGYRTAGCVVQYRILVRCCTSLSHSLTVSYKAYKIGTVLLIIISSRLPARYDLWEKNHLVNLMERSHLHVVFVRVTLYFTFMALGEYIRNSVDVTISPNTWSALRSLLFRSWTDIIDNARKLCNVYDTQRILFRVRTAKWAGLLHPSPPKDRIAWLQSKNSSAIKK
jgi:hypothetical protein